MLVKILISLGMNFRSIVLLSVFLAIFIIGSVTALFSSGDGANVWIFLLTPLIILFFILLFTLISPSIREELKKYGNGYVNDTRREIPPKLFLAFACHGTFVAVGILLVCLLLVLRLDRYLFEIFASYVFLGWIIIYKVMWPFFKRKMRS